VNKQRERGLIVIKGEYDFPYAVNSNMRYSC